MLANLFTKIFLSGQSQPSAIADLPLAMESTKPPPIFNLPTELLIHIFQLLPDYASHKTVMNVALTCHHFESIVIPHLYGAIAIGVPKEGSRKVPLSNQIVRQQGLDAGYEVFEEEPEEWSDEKNRREKLLRTLRAKPSLGDNCGGLVLVANNFSDEAIRGYTRLIWALPRLRSLDLRIRSKKALPPRFWDEIGTALSFSYALEVVEIERLKGGLAQEDIIRTLDGIISLKQLSIEGVKSKREAAIESVLPVTLIPRMYGTAPVKILTINRYHQPAQMVHELIRWPRALRCFQFDDYRNPEHNLDLPTLEEWLLSHKDTLEVIEIGYLKSPDMSSLFNTSGFPMLVKLTLSITQVFQANSWNKLEKLVAGPRLRTIALDFSSTGLGEPVATSCSSEEAQVIRELGRTARMKFATLRRIELVYSPIVERMCGSDGYPWARLQQLRRDIGRFSIKVVCIPPPPPEEKWFKSLQKEQNSQGSALQS